MWRLLSIFRPEEYRRIRVRICDRDSPKTDFERKFSTYCEGRFIELRQGNKNKANTVSTESDKLAKLSESSIIVGRARRPNEAWKNWMCGKNGETALPDTAEPGVQWKDA